MNHTPTMTHLDLLNQLPSPIKEQAIKNAIKYHRKEWLGKSHYDNLNDVLDFGFYWWHTPQGYDYWQNICNRAEAGEFDKPKDPSVTLPREQWEWLLNVVEFNPNPKAKSISESIQSQLKQIK